MTTPGTFLQLSVGGILMQVPVYRDEATTRRLVAMVNAKLQQIEAASVRIDTYKFALLASLDFAAQLEEATGEHAEEERELVRALERIAESLRNLIEDAHRTVEP